VNFTGGVEKQRVFVEQVASTKNIFRISMPAILTYVTTLLIGLVDLFFIGRLGTIPLAAVSIGVVTCTTFITFLEGLRTSTTVLTAQFLGAKKYEDVSRTLNISFVYACIFGVLFFLLAPSLSKLVFSIVKDSNVKLLGIDYLKIRLSGFLFVLILNNISGFFRGFHNTVMPLYMTGFVCLLNVLFNFLLVLGNWGFPALGVRGAAIATVASEGIGAFLSIILLYTSKTTKKKINRRLSYSSLKKLFLKISFESGFSEGLVYLAVWGFNQIFILLGPTVIATQQMSSQIFYITYFPQLGFFISLSVIVGTLFGAKKYGKISVVFWRVTWISFTYSLLASVFTFVFAADIVRFFSPHDLAVVQGVKDILWLICINQVLSTFCLMLRGVLIGINESRFLVFAMFTTGYIFFLPLAYLLGIKYKYGLYGGNIAFIVWSILEIIVMGIWYYRKHKKIMRHQIRPAVVFKESEIAREDYNL
jgi:multidrug resistance protein, MATE family